MFSLAKILFPVNFFLENIPLFNFFEDVENGELFLLLAACDIRKISESKTLELEIQTKIVPGICDKAIEVFGQKLPNFFVELDDSVVESH